MDRIKIDLKNCYGIKALKAELDFSGTPAFAIYAPNGVMKSSLAQTFLDASDNEPSRDRIFPAHKTERKITDEKGAPIEGERILVVVPYDSEIGPNEQTSVLLVNAQLRAEYTKLFLEINAAKTELISAIRQQAQSKKDMESELASAFTSGDDIYVALGRIKDEVKRLRDPIFKDVEYDKIFNDKVLAALDAKDVKDAVENYIQRYNELLDGSLFFKKGTFDYYNAGQIADSLTKNGFFEAKHTVTLKSSGKTTEVSTRDELEKIVADEKQEILKDKKLVSSFDSIEKKLNRNTELREFCRYLQTHPSLLARTNNVDKLREDILKSYLKTHEHLFLDLLTKHDAATRRSDEIKEIARKERTQWDRVIAMFNSRFTVPFELEVTNRFNVMMGNDDAPDLGFIYKGDGEEKAHVDKQQLLEVLSNGEKKALYILNVLFEVETRKNERRETLVVVDDLADSFDYQNKYAIIQYLKDISADKLFKLIIMTHNFDFFRTIANRFVGYGNGLMASKNTTGVSLVKADGINNPFVNKWKKSFFTDQRQKIASICFLRNLFEMTIGPTAPDYLKLTSLLHWKEDTAKITIADLDDAYNKLCGTTGKSANAARAVYEVIDEEAKACAAERGNGMGLENKIVLSIGVRLSAERFMLKKLSDDAFWKSIKKDQTAKLKERFDEKFPDEFAAIDVLDRVSLMTPENIHLNSFMFEPLIDMSDDHLRDLYDDVQKLADPPRSRGEESSITDEEVPFHDAQGTKAHCR